MTSSALLTQGGPVMPLIVLVAAVGLLLACERLLQWGLWYWRDRPLYAAPDGLTLMGLLVEAAPERALTPLAALLSRGQALQGEPTARREALLQALLLQLMPRVEGRIATIGWLGTVLPLLGLLGTVSGLITTFRHLALTTSREVLSIGLSEALWTTEVGLLGALPLLAVHHLLTRLKARWLNQLERLLMLQETEGNAASGAAAAQFPAPDPTPAAQSTAHTKDGAAHES